MSAQCSEYMEVQQILVYCWYSECHGSSKSDYWHMCESSFAKGHPFDALAS